MYTKQELKEKLEEKGVISVQDKSDKILANLKIDPVYEDEKGNEYFDDYVLNLVTENFVKLENKKKNKENKTIINNMELAQVSNNLTVKTNHLTNRSFSLSENVIKGDFKDIIEMFLGELQEYNARTIEAEKRACLMEDSENRIRNEYYKVNSEVKNLSNKLEEKTKQMNELEEYKNKYKAIELKIKLNQLKRKKKSFWDSLKFWK